MPRLVGLALVAAFFAAAAGEGSSRETQPSFKSGVPLEGASIYADDDHEYNDPVSREKFEKDYAAATKVAGDIGCDMCGFLAVRPRAAFPRCDTFFALASPRSPPLLLLLPSPPRAPLTPACCLCRRTSGRRW